MGEAAHSWRQGTRGRPVAIRWAGSDHSQNRLLWIMLLYGQGDRIHGITDLCSLSVVSFYFICGYVMMRDCVFSGNSGGTLLAVVCLSDSGQEEGNMAVRRPELGISVTPGADPWAGRQNGSERGGSDCPARIIRVSAGVDILINALSLILPLKCCSFGVYFITLWAPIELHRQGKAAGLKRSSPQLWAITKRGKEELGRLRLFIFWGIRICHQGRGEVMCEQCILDSISWQRSLGKQIPGVHGRLVPTHDEYFGKKDDLYIGVAA
nr:hypothetical protein Iba_chr15cCG1610 [Ipomoea batatas]